MPAGILQIDLSSPVVPGGYADIYKNKTSILCDDGLTRQFAMKLFRVVQNDPQQISQTISIIKEFSTQQSLMDKDHVNLCSIETINTMNEGHFLCGIIMPWYKNGHILDYIRQRPFKLANKLALATDIAAGLKYLHSIGLVHGNMCPENILITDFGRACITDVGVNTLVVHAICKGFCPIPPAWAYKAPEELMSGIRDPSTDVYSFACTIYAIYVAGPPFQPLRYPYFRGLEQIIDRGHLQLSGPPEGMDQELWHLLRACWNFDPTYRPTITDIERELLQVQRD